jgi:arginyl-tRNA synthetase
VLHRLIEERFQAAVSAVLPGADVRQVLVRPCPDPRFGDYQSNALMSLARERKMNPRKLAEEVAAKLDARDWCESVEIAGAGFLNFRLAPAAIAAQLLEAFRGRHLFFSRAAHSRTIVVDFSSPNIAKPMHVGHIRSTILGDALARTFRLLGHQVVTDNHLGDWGTQFGKLIVGWKTLLDLRALEQDPIGEMERLYKAVNQACEAGPETLDAARRELVKLQAGDPENKSIWEKMIALSQHQFDAIYARLGVKFDFALGESFYNSRLKSVALELETMGIARESEGAMTVFFEEPALKDHPAIVQKSDGAANYTTTDLATIQHRLETWSPDEIVYVTDGRQQLHFQQLFAIFHRWKPDSRVKLAHVWFGAILGDDGRPFKTRAGEVIRLSDLLDEAEERAAKVIEEKNPGLAESEKKEIARIIGIGSVKYADLLPNRQTDYVFSWDKMLALTGNTAPYLEYAHTRLCGIFRKIAEESGPFSPDTLPPGFSPRLSHPEELALAKHLLNFGLTLEAMAEEYRPNYLCNYLHELAGHLSRFYEQCPVLQAVEPERSSRLILCDLSGRVLRQGVALLGIETTERM